LKARWQFGEVKAVDDFGPESIMDVVKEGIDMVLKPARKKES
jgi:hypothetical protein